MNDNSCIIRGGAVVCADRVLPDYDVVVVDGRIAGIEPTGACEYDVQPDSVGGGATGGGRARRLRDAWLGGHPFGLRGKRGVAAPERGHGPEHITVQGGPRAGDPRRNHHLPFAFRLRRTRFRPQAHPRLRQRERAHRPRGGPAGGRRARPSDPPPAAHARGAATRSICSTTSRRTCVRARWTWCRSWITRRAKDSIATCSCSATR